VGSPSPGTQAGTREREHDVLPAKIAITALIAGAAMTAPCAALAFTTPHKAAIKGRI
jgi:hypothetical protein